MKYKATDFEVTGRQSLQQENPTQFAQVGKPAHATGCATRYLQKAGTFIFDA
ncbi:MAG: hypothetical protein RMY28_006880 [Nostoc sp. ChiSLP01]|nr:hypothetical protein [Nostoc sp. CmiSLP01]MDZ8282083.1 hypothetical protein [Nostoc sp. ChiSLP01]